MAQKTQKDDSKSEISQIYKSLQVYEEIMLGTEYVHKNYHYIFH